jgi:phage tail sheath gpL-like
MTISFNNIPAGNGIRVPLFYAEMDNSQANYFSQAVRGLLIGQKLAAGTATANVPVLVNSQIQANTLFGQGSMLARMFLVWRLANPIGEIWALPHLENAAGTAQTGTITVTGPATAAGTINLYIAGQLVQVAVGSTDTATTVAASISTAINAAGDLPITSTPSVGVVTWTCRWKGATGADLQNLVCDSYQGLAGGQSLPTGISIAYAGVVAGITNPTLVLTGMGDEPYDFIVSPYTDATSIAALSTELGDVSGRWAWSREVYGHVYSAKRDTSANLVSAGAAWNDQHLTVAAVDVDTQHPVWEYAASYAAANAVGIAADPARPTQTLALYGLTAPRKGKRFLFTERNSLLAYGIATSFVDSGGTIRVERAITTYQKNALSVSDLSYLDSESLHTSAYVLRFLKSAITSKYSRHKLANDGTPYGAGQAIVTPNVIKGELLGGYKALMDQGIVENADAFAKYLIVERDPTNPNRVNVLYPPDYINQLRVFAVLNQFRLQYPANY